jgi:hypothetical protein
MQIGIWHSAEFNPKKMEIISCNDQGGAWDENTQSCLDEKY